MIRSITRQVRLHRWLLAVAGSLLLPGGVLASNIFDDDWTPPEPVKKATPAPTEVKPPPSPAEPSPPTETPTKPADDPGNPASPSTPAPVAPSEAPIARRAVPGKPEQTAVRNLLKEVFAEQLLDRSVAGRQKLTAELLSHADKAGDSPVDQFILLAAAIEAGTEAANLPLAFDAADRMAGLFEVDALALKGQSVGKLTPKPGNPAMAADNARVGLALAREFAEQEDFASANRICAALAPVIASTPALKTEVQKTQRELAAARDAGVKVAPHLAKLKTAPDDPAANLEVGRYLCYVKSDWKAGLPALARGSDAALKAAAQAELAGPATADARAALGDAWWDLSVSAPGPAKAALQAHAAEWYSLAVAELGGLKKAKVEKRLASLPASPPPGNSTPGKTTAGAATVSTAPGGARTTIQGARLAEVEIDAGWTALAEGTPLIGKGCIVEKLPDVLRGMSFSGQKTHQGTTPFKVTKAGLVLMAVTDRWRGGGGGGPWQDECVGRADLEKQGWQEATVIPLVNDKMKWIVFGRQCKAGEEFTVRTEKYNAPILIR